jgi:hypothetical protein
MDLRLRAAVCGAVVVALAAVPASATAAKKPAKLRVTSLGGVPVSVAPGDSFALTGRVVGAKKRRASAGSL